MATQAEQPPQAYKGLYSAGIGRSFNPSLHAVGASPFAYEHFGAATQRPWNDKAKEPAQPVSAVGGTFVLEDNGKSEDVPTSSGKAPPPPDVQKENLLNAAPPRQLSKPAVEEEEEQGEWWDFLPKLSLCAMNQLGCCAGNDGTRAIARRKALCGVGIVFTEANHGALMVQQVVPRSPAEACGKVKSGDELLSIDGKHVYRMNADTITPLVLGEEGTEVSMTFLRRKSVLQPSDKGEQVKVVLKRRYFMAPQQPPV